MTGYRKRKKNIRTPKRVIFIVCEGSKTEINYFERFNEPFSNVRIKPVHEYTDPPNIVKYAIKIKKEEEVDLDGGDGIWCVHDVDENRNEIIKNCTDHAQANGISVALSNPSFELWFLLHFKDQWSGIDRDTLTEVLYDIIDGGYTKSRDIFDILLPTIERAIGLTPS